MAEATTRNETTVTVLLTREVVGYSLTPAGREALRACEGRGREAPRRSEPSPLRATVRQINRRREAMKAAANAQYARDLADARAECDCGRISATGFVEAMNAASAKREQAFREARRA